MMQRCKHTASGTTNRGITWAGREWTSLNGQVGSEQCFLHDLGIMDLGLAECYRPVARYGCVNLVVTSRDGFLVTKGRWSSIIGSRIQQRTKTGEDWKGTV